MNVSINDGAETFDVTLNNSNITAYSIYLADDWNGSSNANIFWKPTSQLSSMTLSTDNFSTQKIDIFSTRGKINITGLHSNENYSLSIFDTQGRQLKNVTSSLEHIDISDLNSAVYFISLKTTDGNIIRKKIIKQ